MAPRFSSEPKSTSSWLRRDDGPSVIDSIESSGSTWSTRIFADNAINAMVASAASYPRSSGGGGPASAAGAADGAAEAAASTGAASATGAGLSSTSSSGSGSVSVANSTAASRSEFSTSVVLCEYSGSFNVLVASPATVGAD